MTLSAHSLTTWGRCPRRWIFESQWRPRRWHPKALFDTILRRSILALSNGAPKQRVTLDAVAEYQRIAANPGLDILTDPWTLAGDYCAALRTILEALSRRTLLTLHPGPRVTLCDGLEWQVATWADDSGVLHRWATVESIDSDSLARELHSWSVFGDIAAAGVPMVLHLVEIGSVRNGHRHSPWCRIFKHPAIPGRYKFQSTQGRRLSPGWQTLWLAEARDQDVGTWVDLMESDGLDLMRSVNVTQPDPRVISAWREQVTRESGRMDAEADPFSILMRRESCDWPVPCPWQVVCYNPQPPRVSQFGDLGCILVTNVTPAIPRGTSDRSPGSLGRMSTVDGEHARDARECADGTT